MSKKDFDTFNLNICFSSASVKKSKTDVEAKISAWAKEAERLFDDKPALKIKTEIIHNVKGVAADIKFASDKDLKKYMDDEFDNIVGKDKTEGALQVLVVDSISVGSGGIGGESFFPHCVAPFGSKRGIILDVDKLSSSLAHELGHTFSLKHTWDSYVGFKDNCNKDFPKGEAGKGGTRNGLKINLMDYERTENDTNVLNECQRDRSAHQRRIYMTNDGETNYRKLKGLS